MANIALRSPHYHSPTAPATALSAKVTITIDGTLRYTIIKDCTAGTDVIFEISELCRDYLTITFNGTYTAQTITILLTTSFWTAANAGGSQVGSSTGITAYGFEGYGVFMEGVNPDIPFPDRSKPTWLIEETNQDTVSTTDKFYVYLPDNTAGQAPAIDTGHTISSPAFSSTAIVLQGTVAGVDLNIVRISCTKYGDGRKITFVNKYGALQDLYFFLKKVTSTSTTVEKFQANTITSTGGASSYSTNSATKKIFNKGGIQSNLLSSGYYPEFANEYFEQLLLSEFVWLTRPETNDPAVNEVVPVNVKTSEMIHKTSVNDRLIEYTIDFEDAFDYINNVR